MQYHDPARPRLANGLPSWLSAPQVALPRLVLEPLPGGKWQASFMLDGRWRTLTLSSETALLATFAAWTESPEGFVLSHWNVLPAPAETAAKRVVLWDAGEPLDPNELGI